MLCMQSIDVSLSVLVNRGVRLCNECKQMNALLAWQLLADILRQVIFCSLASLR